METRITTKLAGRSAATTFSAIPSDVTTIARQCLLDFVACTVAGADEPAARLLRNVVLPSPEPLDSRATLVGCARRAPALQAALANGIAAHALDYDDTSIPMMGHPTAAVMPAVLALAEETGAGGEALLTAFVAGYETMCRIAAYMGRPHYNLGFHATGTMGAFGAAAASARLLGLDATTTARALSLAATQASGLIAMFGGMGKPLHAGKAAHDGLLAALLARDGFEVPADAVEGRSGFAATHAGIRDAAAALDPDPGRFLMRDNLFKFHAACHNTHPTIENIRTLQDRHGFAPGDVTGITIVIDRSADDTCNIRDPKTPLETKFSLRFAAAAALLGLDTADPALFSPATAARPDMQGAMDLVSVRFEQGWPAQYSAIELRLADGRRLEHLTEIRHGPADPATQQDRLEHKFRMLVEPRTGAAACERLIDTIGRIDTLTAAELGAALHRIPPAEG